MQEVGNIVPIVRNGFTNIYGKHFANIREIAFRGNNINKLSIGNYILMSHSEQSDDEFASSDNTDSVYIYQNEINPCIGYRIYSKFKNYLFNGHQDDRMISSLQDCQKNVFLSQFPTGVVTFNGRIIGQEIPYFPESQQLDKYLANASMAQVFKKYKELLLIVKELYDNGVIYLDIHPGNFLVTKNDKIEIIDFDKSYVLFNDRKRKYKTMILNLYVLFNDLFVEKYHIFPLLSLNKMSLDFDIIMELIDNKEKLLIKK